MIVCCPNILLSTAYSGQLVLYGLAFSIVNRYEDSTFFLVNTVDTYTLSVYTVHIQIANTYYSYLLRSLG